jgi:type II secretory pathway predicted ATPase ExeA
MGRATSSILLILSGQPEFRQIIDELPQLNQRIALRYHLKPLDRTDTEKYIHFRLMKAGCYQELFRPDCYAYLHEETSGVPRLINRHCKLALHFSAYYQKKTIDLETLQLIVKDLLKQNEVA